MDVTYVKKTADMIIGNVSKVMVGNENTIELILAAMLVNGHVLIEDRPGTGKTMMARSIADSISCKFKRVQFTPDLMPSDITGINIYNKKEEKFQLVKGPVFTNILLADEINRATPRTQSSLLEAMEERQVTIDGVSYELESPFMVIATQNNIESVGTYPLPEAQLDRFSVKIGMSGISYEKEMLIMDRFASGERIQLSPVCDASDITGMRDIISQVYVKDCVRRYILDIVMATRNDKKITSGVGTRGVLMLMRTAMAYAGIKGRDYVTPDDVKYLAPYVLGHRVAAVGGFGIRSDGKKMIEQIVSEIEVPVEDWRGSQHTS